MQQRLIHFADTDAAVAEVSHLRAGYTKMGNWSLPQTCWHLNTAIKFTMRPGPHAQPPVDPAKAQILKSILETGRIPSIQAPELAVPGAEVRDSAIDEFLATLVVLKTFKGPFAPHRLFGTIPHDDFVRMHMIHTAHHLGFLIPTAKN